MPGFWLLATLLLSISLIVILKTILGKNKADNTYYENHATLYNQRLLELESEIKNGLLSEAEAKKAKREIQLSLLNQGESNNALSSTAYSPDLKSKWITAVILLLIIPVFVFVVYDHLGEAELVTHATLLSDFHNADSNDGKHESIEKMLLRIEQRLLVEPDDIDGWLMLAKSYITLKRYPESIRAFENLYRLTGDEPSLLLHYADTLAMANSGIFAGKPAELINRALQIEPENTTGLWLAGLAANQRGDINVAVNFWHRLLPKLEEGSESKQKIKQYIKMANQHIGNTQEENLNNSLVKIQVNVSLSPDLSNEINIEDTVFIYAKAIDGPQIPLAVLRLKVSDLPLQATLDDSMAIMPSNKLSDHEQVQLTARISRSGNANPESGDLIGTLNAVRTDQNESIKLIINTKLQ